MLSALRGGKLQLFAALATFAFVSGIMGMVLLAFANKMRLLVPHKYWTHAFSSNVYPYSFMLLVSNSRFVVVAIQAVDWLVMKRKSFTVAFFTAAYQSACLFVVYNYDLKDTQYLAAISFFVIELMVRSVVVDFDLLGDRGTASRWVVMLIVMLVNQVLRAWTLYKVYTERIDVYLNPIPWGYVYFGVAVVFEFLAVMRWFLFALDGESMPEDEATDGKGKENKPKAKGEAKGKGKAKAKENKKDN